MRHVPVMISEMVRFLDPKPNQNFIDCTLGDGGHAIAMLEHIAPNGRVLGIDADPEAIQNVKCKMKNVKLLNRLILAQGNFRNLEAVVKEQKFGPVQGILLDLGFSSSTLERGRGFGLEKDELLDMRFNPDEGIRAAEIVNAWNQKQLRELLEEYGEERLAREIADRIVQERKKRPVVSTKQLVEIIITVYREKLTPRVSLRGAAFSRERSVAGRGNPVGDRHALRGLAMTKKDGRIPWIGGIHPATRTFQALRIAVNDELNALQDVLPQAVDILDSGGRMAVIAFHSLEDRIVKNFFRNNADGKIKIITKKPVTPGDAEIKQNPRARSAKMRVVEKYA